MPNYSKHGKSLSVLDPLDFQEVIEDLKKFKQPGHRALFVFLYYTGVRISEALRLTKESFDIQKKVILCDIGPRMKKGKYKSGPRKGEKVQFVTPPLPIPLKAPGVCHLVTHIERSEPELRVFPYCRKTGYNIIDRALDIYPHYFRLNRITGLFEKGYKITQVRSWTGLTLNALEYYMGIVNIRHMGKDLE